MDAATIQVVAAVIQAFGALVLTHTRPLLARSDFPRLPVAISPIIMTTFAAIFGAIPLALSFGEGGEMRRPLGKPMLRTLTRKREANVIAKEIAVVV